MLISSRNYNCIREGLIFFSLMLILLSFIRRSSRSGQTFLNRISRSQVVTSLAASSVTVAATKEAATQSLLRMSKSCWVSLLVAVVAFSQVSAMALRKKYLGGENVNLATNHLRLVSNLVQF